MQTPKARILIADAFNRAIASGEIKAPVVLGRDHHDVSGTDSPFRETSNIYDGSSFTADMAIQNVIGDSFRGRYLGFNPQRGGVGWGEVINRGFGMLLDGSAEAAKKAGYDASLGCKQRYSKGGRGPGMTVQWLQSGGRWKGLPN
ncbi:MAG: hypothetical protein R2727_01825 [Bacteroidales bacterium]